MTTASGLQIIDTKVGTGAAPKPGQTCVMHYTGWLYENGQKGKKFDSSVDRNEPFEFPIGQHRVLRQVGLVTNDQQNNEQKRAVGDDGCSHRPAEALFLLFEQEMDFGRTGHRVDIEVPLGWSTFVRRALRRRCFFLHDGWLAFPLDDGLQYDRLTDGAVAALPRRRKPRRAKNHGK